MRIVSNLDTVRGNFTSFIGGEDIPISFETISDTNSALGALKIYKDLMQNDIFILNGKESLLFKICFLKYIFFWNRCLIISVDLILRAPESFHQHLFCKLKGILLRKVDYFMFYHKDVSGYHRYFGIDPKKCIYVPFKVNNFVAIKTKLAKLSLSGDPSDGEYVLAAGRSMRDLSTFVEAMDQADIPGIILRQNESTLAENATPVDYGCLPPNVKEVVDFQEENEFIRYISNAKIIVIPRFGRDINATGIATYLRAMALKKCVIISHGPGTTDILLNEEAIIVPPEDADTLSLAIKKAWNDSNYRRKIAINGYKYAVSLKDEKRLYNDIIRNSLELYERHFRFGE